MTKTTEMPEHPQPAWARRPGLGRRLGGWAGLAIVLSVWLGSCRSNERGRFLTPEYTNDLVNFYAKTKLPKGATDIYGHKLAGQSRTVHVRFSCTAQQLQSFLEASPLIPNDLRAGFRPFDRPKDHIPFWRPHELVEIRGLETSWERNGDEVGFLLMTGRDPKREIPIVYMLFVIEHLASR